MMGREAKAFAMALGMMMDNDAKFIMGSSKKCSHRVYTIIVIVCIFLSGCSFEESKRVQKEWRSQDAVIEIMGRDYKVKDFEYQGKHYRLFEASTFSAFSVVPLD